MPTRSLVSVCWFAVLVVLLLLTGRSPSGSRTGLIGHWPLQGDAQDHSGNGNHAKNHSVDLQTGSFDGKSAFLEVPASRTLQLSKGDFSVSIWLHAGRDGEDVPGDLLSQYDTTRRRGFHLSLKSNPVTFSQANDRHLHFGIDDNKESQWIDCGRPGNALLAFALAVHEGTLYAGTCEPGKDESGRVYRYADGQKWIDCGAPDRCNAVTALAVFDGKLYAGVGKYRVAGSALPESPNPHPGGKVYRYDGGQKWTDCGQLPGVEAVGGMAVYRGQLYASSLYRPAGFFRYENGTTWKDAGTPGGKRVAALAVWNGALWATGYDEGHVYRYDGNTWTDYGRLGDNTQTYSFAVHAGRLLVGTWPSGRVYRFEDVNRWTDCGRLGEELEVMGMLVHNGRLVAGTLPLAEVYSYEGNTQWKRLARLDPTPEVRYRRAWTMAEYQGRVYCSTLPSGKVFAFEAGKSVTGDQALPAGWRHVAAIKRGDRLELYLDGKRAARSTAFSPAEYDLTSERPLKIGFGANDFFHGRLRDVRLYGRALTEAEVRTLARQ